MLDGIRTRHGLRADQIAMVGDRLYTDVMMAHRAGALGVLVLTGEATAEDAARATPPPHLTVPSLVELGDLLLAARAR
jgi:NagD protein